MKKETWSFEIPDVHPSLNSWTNMHWTKKGNLKKYWYDLTYFCALQSKIPKFNVPVDVFITYHHPKETVDLDNYTPKFILDPLQRFFGNDNIQTVKKLGWTFEKSKIKKSVIEISLH